MPGRRRTPAGHRGRRTRAAIVAGILALAALGAGKPPAAAGAEDVVETAVTTYELRPADGILAVSVDLSVRSVAGGTRSSQIWIEEGARDVRVVADRGAVTRTAGERISGLVAQQLAFAPLGAGETRLVRLTYVLPGEAPRSAGLTRVGGAYAAFCVFASGRDGGSVDVVVPDTFWLDAWPAPMAVLTYGDRVIYSSGRIANTAAFYRCLEGASEDGFVRTTVTSAAGRPVIVESWPEDPAWRSAVEAEVTADVDALEALVGRALPGHRSIRVREVSLGELGFYAGIFDPDRGAARISELYTEPGVVAHELSHAWFNLDAFSGRWMSEGLASWAERVSPSAGAPCGEPGPWPGTGQPDLDDWTWLGPRSTAAEREALGYYYDAACWIVTSLAARMGEERMGLVIRALLDQGAAYGDEPSDRRPDSGPVDWRTFLDLVDEVGLVPAGVADLELAQKLLLRFGVAEQAPLAGRASARAAYHALAADLGSWRMPDAIRAPLERWQFAEAEARIGVAREILGAAREADAALAGIDALAGPVKTAFEGANDAGELGRALALARAQATAASDVAGALAAIDEPREPLAEIGLAGVELPPLTEEAVAAVQAADDTRAAAAAGRLRDLLGHAAEAGLQRAALVAGGALAAIVLLALALAVAVRRRRSRTVRADA